MADTYWDHPARRETKRLIDLADVGAILDELQERTTEWDDAREALGNLVRAADIQAAALREALTATEAERDDAMAGWKKADTEAEQARADLAKTSNHRNYLQERLRKAQKEAAGRKAHGEKLRAELADANRFLDQRRNDVFMWQQSYNHLAARALRFRLAWQSARQGRRSARLLNRELVASMDVLHGRLQQYMDDKNTAAAHFTNQYSRMHLERDQMRTERDEAREQVKRVRALHYEVCGGACGLGDACECGPRDLVCAECNDRHPCPTIRALDG